MIYLRFKSKLITDISFQIDTRFNYKRRIPICDLPLIISATVSFSILCDRYKCL